MTARNICVLATLVLISTATVAAGDTHIRIMPADGAVFAAGQLFDVRVEATGDGTAPPARLQVSINGKDVTSRNMLAPGAGGERGAGGTGTEPSVTSRAERAGRAADNTTNFLIRRFSVTAPGPITIEARTGDGASARVRLTIERWSGAQASRAARNIILLLGDGMSIAHRTAARIVAKGVVNGKAAGHLAMDTLDVTGLVMTSSLNAVITDSSPGMASYVTGQKAANNQAGVYPDNTPDAFDNPRVEYIGELLRRTRGNGFNVGIVSTADLTDSTPAANAAHTSDRFAGASIAAQFFDERASNGVSVLLGGGARHFMPKGAGGERPDDRRLAEEFGATGYQRVSTAAEVKSLIEGKSTPAKVLGLFHPSHLPVAFDKVGAGSYSAELALPRNAPYRDTPMLDDLARLAIRSLDAHSPRGFYLMIEGASIDKRAHASDAERTIWDIIEFDRAVAVALEYAKKTNTDADATNDTLVIVTADHETGGLALVGVGNDRYEPEQLGRAVRDYAAVFRFDPDQQLNLFTNYSADPNGYPTDPDPSRKLLLGWAAAPDRYENWVSNRLQGESSVINPGPPRTSAANRARDADADTSDNATVDGKHIPGFLVTGVIENGATGCPPDVTCPADTASYPHSIAGHTATDVPLSATGPGAWQFTGLFENTDVFLKMLRAGSGTYPPPGKR